MNGIPGHGENDSGMKVNGNSCGKVKGFHPIPEWLSPWPGIPFILHRNPQSDGSNHVSSKARLLSGFSAGYFVYLMGFLFDLSKMHPTVLSTKALLLCLSTYLNAESGQGPNISKCGPKDSRNSPSFLKNSQALAPSKCSERVVTNFLQSPVEGFSLVRTKKLTYAPVRGLPSPSAPRS